jgi:hypothetical protein
VTLERSERVLDVASLHQTRCRGSVLLIGVRSAATSPGCPAADVVDVWMPPHRAGTVVAAFYGAGVTPRLRTENQELRDHLARTSAPPEPQQPPQ